MAKKSVGKFNTRLDLYYLLDNKTNVRGRVILNGELRLEDIAVYKSELNGFLSIQYAQLVNGKGYAITLRRNPEIELSTGYYFQETDDYGNVRIYTIENVKDNHPRDRFLTCICSEQVNQ